MFSSSSQQVYNFQSLFNVQIAREAYKHTLCVNMCDLQLRKYYIYIFFRRCLAQ